ncbi:MAG: hypothetical protein AAF329_14545 [Cyanobacteria bacterium P01_A01_bin.17]
MKMFKLNVILSLTLISALSAHRPAVSNEPPGRWTKVNEQTLRFVGQIDKRTATSFKQIVTPEITTVVVQSGGGDTDTALQVGQEIHRRQLNIIVDGRCGSSCANYWFVAAAHKIVSQGSWVGFHGNPSSSLLYYDRRQFDQAFLDSLAKFAQQERAFFQALGVDIELVQRSSTITVAFQRPAYLPSPQQLECFGVSNVNMWYPNSVAEKGLLWGAGGNVVITQEVEAHPELASILCNG